MLNIKELRKSKKMSQTDLANEVKVSLRTIQGWEAGESEYSYTTYLKLIEILDPTIKPEPSNNEPQNNENNHVDNVTQIKMNVQVINQLSNVIVDKDKEIEALKRELKECKESERVSPL